MTIFTNQLGRLSDGRGHDKGVVGRFARQGISWRRQSTRHAAAEISLTPEGDLCDQAVAAQHIFAGQHKTVRGASWKRLLKIGLIKL